MTIDATPEGITGLDQRSADTRHFGSLFAYGDDAASVLVAATAARVIEELPDGPELTAGLRKLLEARDCFGRAAAPGVS